MSANMLRKVFSTSLSKSLAKSLPNHLSQCRSLHANTTKTLRIMYNRARDHNAMNLPQLKRSEYLEWNLQAELFGFTQRIQEKLSEKGVRVAFTNKRYVEDTIKKEQEGAGLERELDIEHNEKIAEYGLAILSPSIKSYLRLFLPKLPEEGITALHDFLLLDDVMADISKWIGTSDVILVPDYQPSIETLAQVFKAVVGTIAKEKGQEQAHKFIVDIVMPYLQDQPIFEIWNLENPRTALQLILKNEKLPNYEPRLLRETGRNTILPCFMVGLYVNKELIGSGSAETLDIAEDMAAFNALERLFEIRPSDFVFKFGPKAHNLNYAHHTENENVSLLSWASSLFQKQQKLTSGSRV